MINFDRAYALHENPFTLESKRYEKEKFARLLSLIPQGRIERAIDFGCGLGETTLALSEIALEVIAVDSSAEALRRLLAKIQHRPALQIRLRYARSDAPWPIRPDERASLIVASEVLYYLQPRELETLLSCFESSLVTDGHFITCHYRPKFDDRIRSNREIHDSIVRRETMQLVSSHCSDRYDLLLWRRCTSN